MITFFFRRAMKDMAENMFITVVTMITISLSILIASAGGLLFVNAGDLMDGWKKGVRIMAYLEPETGQEEIERLRQTLEAIEEAREIRYISKETAFEELKVQMKRQMSLLEGLETNPLPDAFEIFMKPDLQTYEKIESLAARVNSLQGVNDVEYGQAWIGRLTQVFALFKFVGLVMGALFFIVTVFIISNTIRLALYSRRDEIEIMRLVGATDAFIEVPSYIAGMIQGVAGGAAGLAILYLGYIAVSSNIERSFTEGFVHLRFLPLKSVAGVLIYSVFVGWLGCFLSLKQFMKTR